MKRLFTLIAFVLLFGASHAQSWINLDSLPIDRVSRSASFSIGTKGYVLAGSYTQTVYSYDAVADAWTTINPYPAPTTDGAVGCSLNGIGYVGTGVQYSNRSNNFFSYDPGTGNWTTLPNFPGAVRAYAVMFALDGKIYLGGGVDYSAYNDFYTYDPAKGAWDPIPIQPCPALGVSCDAVSFVIGDTAYVGSGGLINSSQQSVPQKDFWKYDTTSKIWARIADLPGKVRAEANAFATCDKGFVGLGYTDVPRDSITADFWEYNPAKGSWNQIADFGGGVRNAAFSFTIGKTGYVCAGLSNSYNTQHHDLWSYTPTVAPSFTVASASSRTICAGQSITFNDTSNFSPTNWQWTFQGGTPGSSTDQNPVIRYDSAGVYDVTLMAWNGCDSGVVTFSQYITVGSGGTLTVTANPIFVCSGQPSTLSIASPSGTYQWSPAAGLTDSTSAVITVTPASTTTYTVKQAGGGNCASIGSVVLTVGNNTIGGHVTAVRDTICQGTPGNLTINGNSSNILQWQSSPDNVSYSDISGATSTSYRTTPLLQSTWYHALVGTGSCSATSDSLLLYVPPALTAYFSFANGSPNQLVFNSDSSSGNIRSYHWDFGEGNTSNEQNPSHTFANDTVYYVCLTLYDGSNCSYTFCRYVDLRGDGVPTMPASGNWIVYPNPFSGQLTVSSKQDNNHLQSVEMYNVLGQIVLNRNVTNTTNTTFQLDVSSLAQGMYYVMIRTANADYVQKVVKQ